MSDAEQIKAEAEEAGYDQTVPLLQAIDNLSKRIDLELEGANRELALIRLKTVKNLCVDLE